MRMLLFAALLGGCLGGRPGVDPTPTNPRPAPQVTPPRAPEPVTPAAPAPDPGPAWVTPDPPTPAAPASPAARLRDLVTSAPDSLWACETDADCAIECDLPGNCCGAPCGCRTAVNRHVLAELKTRPWVECTPEQRMECPAMGCAYEPAYSARCDAGRCRADEGFGVLTSPTRVAPPPPTVSCPAKVRSTLPGVTIRAALPSCTIPLDEARAGQALTYTVVVASDGGEHRFESPDGGGCTGAGADGLAFRETIRGVDDPSLVYSLLDTGLCAGGGGVSDLVPGAVVRTFRWRAVDWEGPSDFGNPEGVPFPAGRYEVSVVARGTLDGVPYVVEATLPVTLAP